MPDVVHGEIQGKDAPRLAYSQAGSGRDVILLHGALTTREEMMLALLPALAEQFRVTAFDRPGHGRSSRRGPTGSTWRQAEAVHSAAVELGLQRPVVVGHSYGAAAAMAYALQFPEETAGVVPIAPIAFPEIRLEHLIFAPRAAPGVGQGLNALVSATVDPLLLPALWRAMFLPQPLPPRFVELFPFERAGSMARTEAEGEDASLLNFGLMRSAMNYAGCRTPVRILAGSEDWVVNNALHGRLMARVLPDVRYRELSGLGHMLHHFAQPPVVQAVTQLVVHDA